MKPVGRVVIAGCSLAASLLFTGDGLQAQTTTDPLRDALRQQSAAERSACPGVQRAIADGTDAALVVRTAVELGLNSCQIIRCALEGVPVDEKTIRCEKVLMGAVAGGVSSDVISRCSSDACDPGAVAGILARTDLEPYFCYFMAFPATPLPPPPPREPVFDRSYTKPQASPFTF